MGDLIDALKPMAYFCVVIIVLAAFIRATQLALEFLGF